MGGLRDASEFRHGAGHAAHESKIPDRESKMGGTNNRSAQGEQD